MIYYIILDATGSMARFIEVMLRRLTDMLDIFEEGQLSPLISLVIFRDEFCGEMPELHAPTTNIDEIRDCLKRIKATGGGAEPESSLPAIAKALDLPCDQFNARKVILHITDAGCYDPEGGHSSQSVLRRLHQENVIYFGCTPPIAPYTTFANETGGTLWPIGEGGDFSAILTNVAHTTVKTIREHEPIDSDVRKLIDKTQLYG